MKKPFKRTEKILILLFSSLLIFPIFLLVVVTVFLSVDREFTELNKSSNKIVVSNSFSNSEDSNSEGDQSISIISTGDIGLVRDVNYQIQQRNNPNYPFHNIADYLKNSDLTIINLEGPIVNNCPVVTTGFKFCGEDTNAEGLIYSGIDAASLANNHSTNFGQEGLRETENILKLAGIIPFGLNGQIEYLNSKGKKIALVGFVELGNNWMNLNNAKPENVANLARKAKQNADIVITSFHWGTEYTRKPTQNQKALAHLAIDNGADLVLGNHPHWIQESEIYKDVFITYAQGNTVFDQDWSQETKEGVIYKFEYQHGKISKIDEKYTIIENNSQPRLATEEETANIKRKVST